jgi:OmcA/MtrC family decaheme c-type cytochrome
MVALGVLLGAVACQRPTVGERATAAAESEGPAIVLEQGELDLHGRVTATFSVREGEMPLAAAEVLGLAPRFTLARLTDHASGDGQRAWESLLLTGVDYRGQPVSASFNPGGPMDPSAPPDPHFVTSQRRPGSELATALVDLGGGRFRYVLSQPLPSFDATETIRIGVWLDGATEGTSTTSSTLDFVPDGTAPERRDTVLDDNCNGCHGRHPRAHGEKISGVRLCLTCHTWQNVDPYTVDPAQLVTPGTSATKDPNPLELGRLVHRIHRGKELPTLWQTAWDGQNFLTSTMVPSPTGLPNPYIPYRPFNPARNLQVGRKYSVIAADGREVVYASAGVVYSVDPAFLVTQTLASGGFYPRDLRECGVCHKDAEQGWVTKYAVTRRTCSGCHPEVWFGSSSPAADRVRFPHAGGPQADDSMCAGCHVDGVGAPKLYAPIEDIHVPLGPRAPRYDLPIVEITRVDGVVPLAPGKPPVYPTVRFRIRDRVGPIWPALNNAQPTVEPEGPYSASPVARKFPAGQIVIKIQGPTVPDYSIFGVVLTSGASGNPDPVFATSFNTDEYIYTFGTTLPPGTSGTFVVGMEARRTLAAASPYDKVNDVFRWPYTHEPVHESADNVLVYVNTANGSWTAAGGSPGAVPRRTIVDEQKCLRCHDRIEFHGPARHQVQWCVTCHTPDMADLDKRVNKVNAWRRFPNGPVRIGATYDGIEERSTQLKMHVHRLHTGNRTGAATLEGIAPYVVYFGKAYFFDRGGFPNDLRNCTLCHLGKTYLPENIPPYAPPTRANETSTIWHPDTGALDTTTGPFPHSPDEPSTPPLQAACTACHASSATLAHVAAHKMVDGVEACTGCHQTGNLSVEIAHGLAKPAQTAATASFASIEKTILAPRCASAACHAAGATAPVLEAGKAYGALVGKPAFEVSSPYLLVAPSDTAHSYLLYKLRGDMASAGGSGQLMPPDGQLSAADIAAIEAWIANGAPND